MINKKSIVLPRKRSRSLVQQVMEDLTTKIQTGTYQPGEKMPTEPNMMSEYGVSRTVIREAISSLQAAGFVETRHGIGTFICAIQPPNGLSKDILTVVTIRDVLAMLELRTSLETEAAGLAAQRRTDQQIDLMRRAIIDFEEGINDRERSIDADFQFHLQIALATGNKYFEDFYRHLGKTTIPRNRIDTSQYTSEPGQNYLFRTNSEHQYILEAIIRRDSQTASAGMRMHLSNSSERLRRASEMPQIKEEEKP